MDDGVFHPLQDLTAEEAPRIARFIPGPKDLNKTGKKHDAELEYFAPWVHAIDARGIIARTT